MCEASRLRAAAPPDSGQWSALNSDRKQWLRRWWRQYSAKLIKRKQKKGKKKATKNLPPSPQLVLWLCAQILGRVWQCQRGSESAEGEATRCWDAPAPAHRWHWGTCRLFCRVPEVRSFAVSPNLPCAGMHYISTSLPPCYLFQPPQPPPPPPPLLPHSDIINNQPTARTRILQLRYLVPFLNFSGRKVICFV